MIWWKYDIYHSHTDGIPAAQDVHFQRLEPPMFSVGKSSCVVQVLPSALRFWGKLGLTPHSGKRNVVAFVFLEEGGLEKQRQAEVWLNKMSAGYSVSSLSSFSCFQAINFLFGRLSNLGLLLSEAARCAQRLESCL
jgi:hypothetical protein